MSTGEENPAEWTARLRRNIRRSEHCFVDEMAFWSDNLKTEGYMRGEMSSLALQRLRMGATEEMQMGTG